MPTTAPVAVECVTALLAGQAAADTHHSVLQWGALSVFAPVVGPLLAAAMSQPVPPPSLLQQQHSTNRGCFADGYRERARGRNIKAGWIGTAISAGFVALAVSPRIGDRPYDPLDRMPLQPVQRWQVID